MENGYATRIGSDDTRRMRPCIPVWPTRRKAARRLQLQANAVQESSWAGYIPRYFLVPRVFRRVEPFRKSECPPCTSKYILCGKWAAGLLKVAVNFFDRAGIYRTVLGLTGFPRFLGSFIAIGAVEMLLTISTTHEPATDLGYLLHKHPDRCQSFDLSFGQAHVFYPEASKQRTTVAILLDVDPVGMVRGKSREQSFLLGHYVNDRPYVASSFLSVAISQVFGSAISGRCKDREELAKTPIPLTARIEVLPVRGGEGFIQRMFEPLGYAVDTTRHPLDEQFPEWGDSSYFSVTITGTKLLSELLTHLYVLIPVFDNQKHYFVGDDELEKLLDKGADWLASHPEKEQITRRYLRHRSNLYREALARLAEEVQIDDDEEEVPALRPEESLEQSVSLNEQRLGTVLAAFGGCGARSVGPRMRGRQAAARPARRPAV